MTEARTLSTRPDSDGFTLRDMAKAALAARMTKNLSEPAIIAIMLKAEELGVPPMQALSQIHVINGVPSCSAQLMLSLAYQKLPGFEFELTKSTADVCDARMRRASDKPWVGITYTYAQAQSAGLTGKDNWKKHPDDMLRNRVVSKLLKMVAPDTFAGVYTVDEAGSIAPRIEIESNTAQVAEMLGVEDGSVVLDVAADDIPPEPAPKADTSVSDVAMDDWRMGLDQADTPEALAAQVDAIESDMRLDLMARGVLLGHADGIAKERGWE